MNDPLMLGRALLILIDPGSMIGLRWPEYPPSETYLPVYRFSMHACPFRMYKTFAVVEPGCNLTILPPYLSRHQAGVQQHGRESGGADGGGDDRCIRH